MSLVFTLVLALSGHASSAATEHEYNRALNDFIKGAAGRTSAILYDIDNNGVVEMIAFDEGIMPGEDPGHWADLTTGARIAVYSIIDGGLVSSSMEPEFGHLVYMVYISGRGDLIVYDSFEGYFFEISKYTKGVMEIDTILVDGSYADEYYYAAEGVEIAETEFNKKLIEYGVYDVAAVIGCGEWARDFFLSSEDSQFKGDTSLRDDTQKILRMTDNDEPKTSGASGGTANGAPGAGQSAKLPAVPTEAAVVVNGKPVSFDAYEIEGFNYFKLRDLAYVLNGTAKQFDVGYDEANDAVKLTGGAAYKVFGGEMAGKSPVNKTAAPTGSKILLNGKEISLTAYVIDDYNYFKLRDVGAAIGFDVGWNEAARTISIDT